MHGEWNTGTEREHIYTHSYRGRWLPSSPYLLSSITLKAHLR